MDTPLNQTDIIQQSSPQQQHLVSMTQHHHVMSTPPVVNTNNRIALWLWDRCKCAIVERQDCVERGFTFISVMTDGVSSLHAAVFGLCRVRRSIDSLQGYIWLFARVLLSITQRIFFVQTTCCIYIYCHRFSHQGILLSSMPHMIHNSFNFVTKYPI